MRAHVLTEDVRAIALVPALDGSVAAPGAAAAGNRCSMNPCYSTRFACGCALGDCPTDCYRVDARARCGAPSCARALVCDDTRKREMFANGIETTGKNVVDTWSGGVLGNGRRLLTLDADIARVVLIAGVVGRVALRRRGREMSSSIDRCTRVVVHEHVPSPQ